ncbi:GNAT family N-acetyltransferase [Pseudonocardia sp. TRM90224]|uniref:GNAT family N-acetyltransferase n=1 Tax=Pseudonocardia sp. TRM90224 TaxID=2812678 RepID=UPI001E57F23A|nr:GNAT family N-acetyltransferase [Pseudonocardia sp. TRM90224]
MILPLRTARLALRALVPSDAPVITAYRNDPAVARFQDWDLPVTAEATRAYVERQSQVTGPVVGKWVQIGVEYEGELAGDLAVGLDDTGRIATIGYTLRADRQRLGIGREAVGALVDTLFEQFDVHLVTATLDPENAASARLLEDLGFRYEGRGKAAALVRGSWEDDDRYALLRSDRAAWLGRPAGKPDEVTLVEITPSNVREVARLATHHSQERFVATMAASFQDALVPELVGGVPAVPWMRAIAADGELVGFVMVAEASATEPDPYLWRLLIDRRHQRRGIGARVVELLAEHVRNEGARGLTVSWAEGLGGPEQFYRKLGFVPTGEIEDGEIVARLDLTPPT